MAGWMDSTGTGRGGGGRGFPNRRYTSDTSHGGSSSSGGGRWRGDMSRGRPPPQPHHYRPIHRHPSPSVPTEQPTAPTATRHTQMTRQATAVADKSSTSGTVGHAGSNQEPEDKGSRNAANFECNVCFDMAAEPVVTKCGHLFCWDCLYQWLHVHSNHRECPVCKGQVAEDAVIPIYGRGGSAASVGKAPQNAPPRPNAIRVESSRQQQNNHRQQALPYQMVYMDDDEEEDNPFDLPSIVNFGLGSTTIRDAVRSFMSPSFDDVDMDDQYDEYSYEFNPEDFDEIYDYDYTNFMEFPMFASADNPGSSQMHADFIDLTDPPVHHQEFSYSGRHSHNRGRRGRRYRARASAEQSSTDATVTGVSGSFYRDNVANSNASAGVPSQPNSGWAERRGRSHRNSNSAGGRGIQDGRRQRGNYN